MNRDQFNEALDEFQRQITDITNELEREIIVALRDEYQLIHTTDNDDTISGRHAAVRGMAMRLGVYVQFERAIQ